jgi:hypothetical protein
MIVISHLKCTRLMDRERRDVYYKAEVHEAHWYNYYKQQYEINIQAHEYDI